MRNLKYILFTTLLLFTFTGLFGADEENPSDAVYIPSLPLHIRITEMTESEPPFIVGEDLIFTYTPSKSRVRHVGIAFENENFSTIHNLHRNENGIYFFLYKYPKEEIINYKFIEDGVWTLDKNSQNSIIDRNFISLSSFTIPQKNLKEHISPFINGRNVTFEFKGEPGSSVYLTGDFNNWNPFLYKLAEEKSGIYRITLNNDPGLYGYYFIYNGERILDAENPIKGRSRIGEEVSLFTIE